MKRVGKIISLAVLGAVLLLMSACNSQNNNKEAMQALFSQKEQIIIDCFGDSITWGMFSSPQLEAKMESGEIETGLDDGGQLFEDVGIYISGAHQSNPSYPELLERELNRALEKDQRTQRVTVYNDGICGDWLTNDSWERMSCTPDVVVMLFGGNNYYFGFPVEGTFEKNIQVLKDQGTIVYLANYPLYPEDIGTDAFEQANRHIAKIAGQEKIPLIDFYTCAKEAVKAGDCTWDAFFSPDHIHLSEKGYDIIGRYAAESIYEDIK